MDFDLILLFLLIFCLLLFSGVREDLIISFQSFDGEYRIYRLQNVSERCLSAVREDET